ncbi:C4-dicarboxylate ABC transporter substrate-binding protein [Pueribacillus theae]|uniref:C4-dicarboxylate ABC transporter substrate-binding protein n=1 Tax=Pueribacillus theae TaxID=2171751 RepID=A0A2U1K4F1_9BACI|nr:TRAP transporter substrate-binding protein [Pueribacillus theae]PWA11828.1 C4-dicarboxylate ABC transporter substrate-binding protein [Pueribacillus theae]
MSFIRKFSVLAFYLFAILLIAAGCGNSQSSTEGEGESGKKVANKGNSEQEKYVIKFAHVVSASTAKGKAAEKFAEVVSEKTDGQIEVEIYPDSQLGNDREIIEQMQSGTVQMNAPFTGVLPSFVKQFEVFDLPFIFSSTEEAKKAMQGELGEQLNQYLTQQGLRGLGYWDGGLKHLTNSVRPIEKPEDMKGLKIRTSQSPLLISQFQALGAGGVSIDFAELYTALQTKTVDGQENPLSNIVSKKLYEVQDYLTISSHGYMGYVLMISEDFYQSLPKDLQTAIDEAAKEASEWQWKQAAADEEEYMKVLEDSGIEITELTAENREAFIEATKKVYDEFKEIDGSEELLNAINGEK